MASSWTEGASHTNGPNALPFILHTVHHQHVLTRCEIQLLQVLDGVERRERTLGSGWVTVAKVPRVATKDILCSCGWMVALQIVQIVQVGCVAESEPIFVGIVFQVAEEHKRAFVACETLW